MADHNTQTEDQPPAGSDEAPQDAAQASDTKAEATSTTNASDELSEDDLEAVSGGAGGRNQSGSVGHRSSPKYSVFERLAHA